MSNRNLIDFSNLIYVIWGGGGIIAAHSLEQVHVKPVIQTANVGPLIQGHNWNCFTSKHITRNNRQKFQSFQFQVPIKYILTIINID